MKEKDGKNRPVINLKKLNQFISYNHLKIESLLSIKDILKKGNFMYQSDLKDAYFYILCDRIQGNMWGFTGKAIYISSFAIVLTCHQHFTFSPNIWKY